MDKELILQTISADETIQLGEDIGRQLKGGEIIELSSDLGGGKTTFVRGLATGAGSTDHVSSPTFTVSKVYKTEKFSIHHFDFYRLGEAGLMEHELKDLLQDNKDVIVVEWGAVIEHVLPDKRLQIEIQQLETEGREIRLSFPETLSYLLEKQ